MFIENYYVVLRPKFWKKNQILKWGIEPYPMFFAVSNFFGNSKALQKLLLPGIFLDDCEISEEPTTSDVSRSKVKKLICTIDLLFLLVIVLYHL